MAIGAAMLTTLALVAACESATESAQGSLQGTWVLVSVNGVQVPAGALTWTIDNSTISAVSGPPDPCTGTYTYTVSGNVMTVTTTNFSGSGCGGEIGDVFQVTFEVSGSTLTVVVEDPDLGTGTFTFTRS